MWVISAFALLLFLLYARLFLSYMKGWNTIVESNQNEQHDYPSFSILIPFRNEAESLPNLTHCLGQLNTADLVFEILFIDDHSEDESKLILEEWLGTHPEAKYIRNQGIGKKAAIQSGIDVARYEFILCTDADVRFKTNWLQKFAQAAGKKVQLISGPVQLEGPGGFFHRWQELEFSGLIAIGAASIKNKRPNMCNGANLAYRKSAFEEVEGFSDNEHLLSGDDEFLMHKVFARYGPEAVTFLKDEEAMVYTDTISSLKAFLSQRSRWSSKATHYKDKRVTLDLFIGYFAAIFALSGIVLFPFNASWALPGLVFLSGKTLLEYLFFKTVLPFFRQERQLKAFLISELFQVVYVVVIGVLGTFVKFEWKGRKQ